MGEYDGFEGGSVWISDGHKDILRPRACTSQSLRPHVPHRT
jgi:hypothetical protein